MNTLTDYQPETESLSADVCRISIQGIPGAFHDIAARKWWGERSGQARIVPAHSFPELVEQITQKDEADIGLMAIENTLAGSIMRNYQLVLDADLEIIGEVYLRIQQNLLVLPGQSIEDLREVHSHYMAIAQCRRYFSQYPHIKLVETADTALSARELREHQRYGVGAIASDLAAELYGLEMLAPSIETNKLNYTRFWVIQPKTEGDRPLDGSKATLSFTLNHTIGSLHQVLAVFSAYEANLTKIQSAPIPGRPWEYRFLVDFVRGKNFGTDQVLQAIKPLTGELVVLGCYPAGKRPGTQNPIA